MFKHVQCIVIFADMLQMNYHIALEERVRKLVAQGREVIVLGTVSALSFIKKWQLFNLIIGDINICSTPLDHCDGHLPSNQENFYHHPARRWFHKWIGPEGPMTDVVRTFHPNREGMYTCELGLSQRVRLR
jgi:AP endonuclease-2